MRMPTRQTRGRTPGPNPHPRRGVTLLEMLIAAVIFAITMTALFMAFRTGTRAWQAGHGGSEVFQAARIVQDVVIRDLNNVYYRTETDYNLAFRNQLQALANNDEMRQRAMAAPREQQALLLASIPAPPKDVKNFPPPIDLSFRGEDNGDTDEVTFMRRKPPQAGQRATSLGLRRVRLFVSDGTLYRQEISAYGLRPGESLKSRMETLPSVNFAAAKFIREEPPDEPTQSASPGESQAELPDSAILTEPLCEGVTLFNIVYGYYHDGEWIEVGKWDSNAYEYRFPGEEPDYFAPQGVGGPGGGLGGGSVAASFANPIMGSTESGFNPQQGAVGFPGATTNRKLVIVRGQPMSYSPHPDDLPGYMAIHMGVQNADASNKKVHYFTYYFSFPSAVEDFDPEDIDEDQRLGGATTGGGAGAGGGFRGADPAMGGLR